MLTYWEILTAIQSNVSVSDSYAQLWGRKSQNNYTVVTYTGTLPATLTGTKAGYLHRYKIYGNTVQDGTPTPEKPIMPSECGVRTAQIFDISKVDNGSIVTHSGDTILISGGGLWYDLLCFTTGTSAPLDVTKCIFLAAGTYTLKIGQVVRTSSTGSVSDIVVFSEDGTSTEQLISAYNINNSEKTFTTATDGYISLRISSGKPTIQGVVLTAGSIAPSTYIPYGYKLPLASGSTPVDIYLGESQTTRRIKKLVLTGEETSWGDAGGNAPYRIMLPDIVSTSDKNSVLFLSTHYLAVSNNASWARYNACVSWSFTFNTNGKWLQFRDTNQASLDDFKTYLAEQYANGTPVTIWYVLAEPETGTLNEPLRKIGDYADTIDSTQTTAQIPTSAGSTTISWAGEGLAPSQVELEYEKKR